MPVLTHNTTFSQTQMGSVDGFQVYNWNNANNWTFGIPANGTVNIDITGGGNPSGYDDIASLTLGVLNLQAGYLAVGGALTVDSLVVNGGTGTRVIYADTILGVAAASLTIDAITGSGAFIQAIGSGAVTTIAASVTDPGEVYQADSGGMLIMDAAPNASSEFDLINRGSTVGDTGTIAFERPGSTVAAVLGDVGVGSAVELPGGSVSGVTFGASSISITTNLGTTVFSNVWYTPGELVSGYTASFDAGTGLEKITFTGGNLTTFQQSVGVVVYGGNIYDWSNAANWSNGVPTNGGGVTLDIPSGGNPSGYDDIASLTLGVLNLQAGYLAVGGALTVDSLVVNGGTGTRVIYADTILGVAAASLTIDAITGSGAFIQAIGSGAVTTIAASVTDPGEVYQADSGGMLIMDAAPNASSEFDLIDSGYTVGDTGTIAFDDTGNVVAATLGDVGIGSAVELRGSSVLGVAFGASSISITTNLGATVFSNVWYTPGELVSGYTASFDAGTGLEKITFAAPAAQPLVEAISPIAFGAVRQDQSVSRTVTVENAAGAESSGLNAAIAASGAATASGSITGLAPGDSAVVSAGLNTAHVGVQTGSVALTFASDGGGVIVTPLPADTTTLQVTGTVYAEAAPSLNGPANFVTHVGTAATVTVELQNTAAVDGYSEDLIGNVTSASSGITAITPTTGDLAAGATGSLTLDVSAAIAGVYSGDAIVDLVSDGTPVDGLGRLDLGTTAVGITGTVFNYAIAALSNTGGLGTLSGSGGSYTLDLGSVTQAGAMADALLTLNNVAGGLADTLGAVVTESGQVADFITSGIGTLGPVAAGSASSVIDIGIKTTTTGTFSETLSFVTSSVDSAGSTTLTPISLVVTGTIVPPAGQVFTLTTAADTVAGNAGANTVIATAGALSAGDQINAGSGDDSTLALQGVGIFDLALPTTLTGIDVITAQEGQASSVSGGKTYASTVQTVTLRAGMNNVTVEVAAATLNGSPKIPTITIIGAANNDVIDLASGNDAVALGAGETVNGGSGTDTFTVAAAAINQVTINGGTGGSEVSLSGGGSVTIGSNVSSVATLFLASSTAPWNVTGNGISGLVIQDASTTTADTIKAGGANQVLTGGGAGKLTMVGAASDDTTFKDTATLLNGDTLQGFAAGDLVDITGLKFVGPGVGQTSFTLTPNAGHTADTLAVYEGGALQTSMTVSGVLNGNFSLSSDGGTGTLLRYYPT